MSDNVIKFPAAKVKRKPKHTWAGKIAACLTMAELLPPKEVEFLQNMSEIVKSYEPTAKQRKWIDDIIRRLREWNEDLANG